MITESEKKIFLHEIQRIINMLACINCSNELGGNIKPHTNLCCKVVSIDSTTTMVVRTKCMKCGRESRYYFSLPFEVQGEYPSTLAAIADAANLHFRDTEDRPEYGYFYV